MEANWDADQYLKFRNERTQPATDLAARISHENPRNIVDAGCGPGNSTDVLLKNWPSASITGFDSSTEMLNEAKSSSQNIEWFESTVEDWRPTETYDIIFSNAVLQWVENHESVLPRLMSFLNDSGALAIQMPAHYKSPLHQQLVNIAAKPDWAEYTESARPQLSLAGPSFYYDLLAPMASRVAIWETQYFHVMDSVQAILEWFRGTGLRPFLQALPNDQARQSFEHDVLQEYSKSYPQQADEKVLFPFNRFFLIAYK